MKMKMSAEDFVIAVLGALPTHEVKGRKRLQKLAFFAAQTGAEADVRFFLHDFGPFSAEIAGATDLLSLIGAISERDVQFERTRRFYKVYRLSDAKGATDQLPSSASDALRKLNEYSTLELEIASTIRYFIRTGLSTDKAIEATKNLKPSKSEPKIIKRAQEALSKVGLDERGRTDQVSSSRSY
jgi:uncharacterized protein YwgA